MLKPEAPLLPSDPGSVGSWSVCVSTCGHFMHYDCFLRLVSRQRGSDGVLQRPYLCPLCKTNGNALLPLLSNELPRRAPVSAESTREWLLALGDLYRYTELSDAEARERTAQAAALATTAASATRLHGVAGAPEAPADEPRPVRWTGSSFGLSLPATPPGTDVDGHAPTSFWGHAPPAPAEPPSGVAPTAPAAEAAEAGDGRGRATPSDAGSAGPSTPLLRPQSPFIPPARQPADERRELGAFSTVGPFRRLLSPRLPGAASPSMASSPPPAAAAGSPAAALAPSAGPGRGPARMQRTGSRLATMVHSADTAMEVEPPPTAPVAVAPAAEPPSGTAPAAPESAAAGRSARETALRNRLAMARDLLPLAWSRRRSAEQAGAAGSDADAAVLQQQDALPPTLKAMLLEFNVRLYRSWSGAPQPPLLPTPIALAASTAGRELYGGLATYLATLQVLEASYRGRPLPSASKGPGMMRRGLGGAHRWPDSRGDWSRAPVGRPRTAQIISTARSSAGRTCWRSRRSPRQSSRTSSKWAAQTRACWRARRTTCW